MGKQKNFKERGITLVALIITIILLLILAGIAISSLTGSGLFEKVQQAKQEQENAQIKEEAILADYENKIGGYIDNSRNNYVTKKSLINKDDGVYSKTDGGYVFTTNTTTNNITSNNTIKLTESIDNYDYILFEIDMYNTSSLKFTYQSTELFSVDKIKMDYSNTIIIANNYGNIYNWVNGAFGDSTTFIVKNGLSNNSIYSKLRITDIKGIK